MEIILHYTTQSFSDSDLSFALFSEHKLELQSGKLLIPACLGNTHRIDMSVYSTDMKIKSITSDLRINIDSNCVNYEDNRVICFMDSTRDANIIDLEGNKKDLSGSEYLALLCNGLFWIDGKLLTCSITYDYKLKSISCRTMKKQYSLGFSDVLLLTRKAEIDALVTSHNVFKLSELYENYKKINYVNYKNNTELTQLSMLIDDLNIKYTDYLHVLKSAHITKILEFRSLRIKHCVQITTDKWFYYVYPILFASLLNENNNLFFNNESSYECIDLSMFDDTVVCKLLEYIYSNRFPKMDELIAGLKIDIVTTLYKLCEYMGIEIYKKYFSEIKDSHIYNKLLSIIVNDPCESV